MKKFVFFTFALGLSWSYLLNAQCDSTLPVSENFSDKTAVEFCWDFIDDDGDGYNWYVNNFLISESYTGSSGYLTPDNWAITHAIDLRSYSPSSNVTLSWSVRAPDWSFDQERYSVYAATGNQTSNFTSSSVTVFENLDDTDASGAWGDRSLDISSLAGNMVYIAFRHYASVFQDQINIDDVVISAGGSNGGCTSDSDNDGVCDIDDQCPGEDDTIDTNNNGIPDGCEDLASCTEQTANFSSSPLTHSGSGSNSTNVSLPSNSQDISFTISGINQKLKGKSSSKFTEKVVVTYKDGAGVTKTNGTYSGGSISSATINIQGKVQSITVSLSDGLDGNTGANMSVNLSTITYCVNTTPCTTDSDNDGVCDADDQCPGFDDTIDTNNNGIPDGCEDLTGCVENTVNFNNNPLTHTGSGFNSTSLNLPANSQDVSFTISGIGQKLKGKASSKYIEHVEVTYVDGSGASQTYNTFSGANASSVTVNINEEVQSITVSLSDELDGSTSTNMTINFSAVSYCVNSSSSAKSSTTTKLSSKSSSLKISTETFGETIKIYPNPVSNTLFVKHGALNGTKTNITLYNINGVLVRNIDFNGQYNNTESINLKGLAQGMYLLRMSDQDGMVLKTQKILVR